MSIANKLDMEPNEQGQTFSQWKTEVDRELVKLCDIPSEFLPDVDYYGMWKTGQTPKEAADYALEYAKGN